MQQLSHIFKNRPMTPQESVVFWTEYVIKYNGAPHLKTLGQDMPIHEYLMLDIILVVVLGISLIFMAFRLLICLAFVRYNARKSEMLDIVE